jgi:hypothetical protein
MDKGGIVRQPLQMPHVSSATGRDIAVTHRVA